jgi:sugar phosphate isomerase/epimerase
MKRVYPHPMTPEDYPEFIRRYARATTRPDLDDTIQFATLRGFTEIDNRLVDIKEKIDLYTEEVEMGKVVWPFVSTLYVDNFDELVAEIKKRKLFLFDFWGYVPGTNTAGQSWGQYKAPHRPFQLVAEELGSRFLGMDNGEQDGRYIGAYAHLMYPDTADRKKQYLNFYDYFEQLTEDMRHRITVLCSLNYGHYFAHKGDHIMVGAETAQALPNNNLWYAYLRGAGKQYGLLWFGNASVWNRFGWKNYSASGQEGTNNEHSAESGTSLSLLRRLMYTQYMYNCAILGFESGWFYSEGLNGDKELGETARPTPIGEVQHGCIEFTRKHQDPGVLYTPTAVLLDFYNGWTFPRHLYTKTVYKVWGNIPYAPGDYQIESLFSMIYPGYENAGFYHDERGFMTPTPYGDSVDVLFNNARGETLNQYNLIILAGEQRIDEEVADKLERFVSGGGHLVISAAHLPKTSVASWIGVASIGETRRISGTTASYNGRTFSENEFELTDLVPADAAEVIAEVADRPLIIRHRHGDGIVDVIASPYGLNGDPLVEPGEITNDADEDIPVYHRYIESVSVFLDDCLEQQKIVDIGNRNLQFTTNWLGATTVTVSIANNGESAQTFSFSVRSGEITSVAEWEIHPCPADTLGYFPAVSKERILGDLTASRSASLAASRSADTIIEPGDIRIFELTLADHEIASVSRIEMTDTAAGRMLSLWRTENLRDEILCYERLGQHFEGIKIEAKYLLERDPAYLKTEGAWFKRQKLDCMVDFIGLLNFYPNLTLIGNIEARRDESMRIITSIFDKMHYFGIDKALFSLHRNAENNFTAEQAAVSFENSFSELADLAAARGIQVFVVPRPLIASTSLWQLKMPGVDTRAVAAMVRRLAKNNLKFCLDTSHLLMTEESPSELLKEFGDEVAMVLVGAPVKDQYGQYYNAHRPVSGSPWEEQISQVLRMIADDMPGMPVCLNAQYPDWDEVYRDIRLL